MKCHRCEATVPDDNDETLAAARWGFTYSFDPGWNDERGEPLPSAFYACPDCSDPDKKDAFRTARKQKDAALAK